MIKRIVVALIFVLLLCSVANADNRVALIIGNGAYFDARLVNPANDARSMGRALGKLGFNTTVLTDVDKRSMEDAIRNFGASLKPGTTGLFYFAGHGMQVGGSNYLIPVGANMQSERDVPYESVDASRVLSEMHAAKNGVNIVILDACRNNPFARSFRTGTRGLARMDAPSGSFIAYATAPGKVAADGSGSNGVFTAAILKNISMPGLDIDDLFREVRKEVKKQTRDQQVPWQSSSMTDQFYFQKSKDWGKELDKKSAEYKRLQDLAARKDAEDKKRTEEEAAFKARIAKMDAEVEAMKERLGSGTALPDDSLQAMLAMVKNKEAEKKKLDALKKARAEEEAKRMAAMQNLERERILKLKEVFSNDAKAYKEIVSSEYGATMADAAWQSLVKKYPTLAAGCAKGDIAAMLAKSEYEFRPTWTDPTTGMKFVWVPGGCYQMGSNSGDDDEKPVHEVCVDGFWMGKYEVTNAQYRQYKSEHNSMDFEGNSLNGDRQPAVYVSWNDAKAYADWLSSKGNGTFRLPTEAEWEYAARSGGNDEKYAGGNEVDRVAWYRSNSGKKTHPVGTKAPNGLGLYDMSGNVWEWCQDWYKENANSQHARQNPIYSGGGGDRVFRGGSWGDDAGWVRAADPGLRFKPGNGSINIGFRLLRTN